MAIGRNAGTVKRLDIVEIWTVSKGYETYMAPKFRVEPVPSDCYLAFVNGELRIDLEPHDVVSGGRLFGKRHFNQQDAA